MNIIRFGVLKPVPINLLMVAVILAGVVAGLRLRREFFPQSDPDTVIIQLPYPGARPEEVEQTLAMKVEDKLAEIDEVDEYRSVLAEGGGGITVKLRDGVNADKAVDEIERAVDSLIDLPDESERIQVALFEPRMPVIQMAIHGDLDEEALKRAARGVRDDLRTLPQMGEVLITGVRDYEIRVDVRNEAMLQQGISLPQVSDAIRSWMQDVPGGTVRSRGGNIKVRTMGVEERASAIAAIILKLDTQGRAVTIGDVARVSESFVDEQIITRYNEKPAANLMIFAVGKQDIVKISEMTKAYVAGRRGEDFHPAALERIFPSERRQAWALGASSARALPPGAAIGFHSDYARFVEGRLDLLVRNACYGGVLVFATLLLFLNWRAAFWVGVGLMMALAGTLVLMQWLDITLNLLTMFGLIVVLGLLVDDAIVVAENIQSHHDAGEPALSSAITGTTTVFWPVVATVLTTVVAFLPLTFIRGNIGNLLGALPLVVTCALIMSLLESLLVLPSHMGHSLAKRDAAGASRAASFIRRLEALRDSILLHRIIPAYGRLLKFLLHYRYVSLSAAVAVLLVSLGMVVGGRIGYTFLPRTDAETIMVDLRMPIGAPAASTEAAVARIESAVAAQPETRTISTLIGTRSNIQTGAAEAFAPHVAQIFIELLAVEDRDRESALVVDSIRHALAGQLNDIERLNFTELSGGPTGPDISIRVSGEDAAQVEAAVGDLRRALGKFEGVHEISDDNDRGQVEMRIILKPGARATGFNQVDVARQVRGALFGLDAHVFASEQEDIDVRVRLDEHTRTSLSAVENLWLVSPAGKLVPLQEIADTSERATYASIKRVDGRRAVTVTAQTAAGLSPEVVVAALPVKEIRTAYPLLDIRFAGRQEQFKDAFGSLPYGFLAAMVMIYVILAWLFSSYLQPLLIMVAIPFATVGVIWGHFALGYELTFMSLIGFVALSGIVVNDSLILIQFYNAQRTAGHGVAHSIINAGRARLRAILLTTITTVLGLLPLILERSLQAKFLIPMAIAVAMGLIASTFLILLVLPCLVLILDDLRRVAYYLWHGRPRPADYDQPITLPPEPAPALQTADV